MDIEQLHRQFDLQRTALTHDVHIHDQYCEPEPPPPVMLIIGVGGWIVALAVTMLAYTFVTFLFGEGADAFWLKAFGIGIAFMVLGLLMRYVDVPENLAEGFVLGGVIFAAAEIFTGLPGGKFWPAAVLFLFALPISVRLHATPMLQAIMAVILAMLIAAAVLQSLVIDRQLHAVSWIFALQSLLGVLLFMVPARTDLRPIAGVALISAVLSPILLAQIEVWPEQFNSMQISRLINVSTLIILFMMAWVGAEGTNRRLDVAVFSLMCLPAVILLPPAGSSALIVLVLAWCRGSPSLALMGAVLQLAFIANYFFDPSASLITATPGPLDKAAILGGLGLMMLAIWAMLAVRHTGRPK